MADLTYEEMRVLVLNTRNRVVDNVPLYRGTMNSSVLRAAEIFRLAIVRNCPAIIICHSHPSGDPAPSSEDLTVTQQLVEVGKLLDIELTERTRRKPLWFLKGFSQNTNADMHREQEHSSPFCASIERFIVSLLTFPALLAK